MRSEVQQICESFSDEQKHALAALSEIKAEANKEGLSEKAATEEAVKLQRKIRRGRKKSRR